MNVTRHFIRRSTSLCMAARSFASCSRTVRCSILQPSLRVTPAVVSEQMKIMCRHSSNQSGKFEVINVQDEEDFKKRVLGSTKPIVVDFYANWCGPCKLLGPRLEKLVSEGDGDVLMAKVDIDDNSDLAMEYGVRSVPTVLGMKGGKVHSQFVGLIDDDQIQTFVDKLSVS